MNEFSSNTSIEKTFLENELIISRTDTKGIITYANSVFVSISGYSEKELLGKPHSIIRHPDMPKAVFKLLWETLHSGNEIFAYVKNRCKDGAYYWVIAHVTPTYDSTGHIIGYHSNRRCPQRDAIAEISKIYAELLRIEREHTSTTEGVKRSYEHLTNIVASEKKEYNELILSI